MKKVYIIGLILIFVSITVYFGQANIHTASAEELQEINGIGEINSLTIVSYLEYNKTATIDDLESIHGIGKVTVRKLNWRYND